MTEPTGELSDSDLEAVAGGAVGELGKRGNCLVDSSVLPDDGLPNDSTT